MKVHRGTHGWCATILLLDGRTARVVGDSQSLVMQQADYWRRWAKIQSLKEKR